MFGGCPLTIEMYGPINVPGEGGLLGVLIRHLGTPALPQARPVTSGVSGGRPVAGYRHGGEADCSPGCGESGPAGRWDPGRGGGSGAWGPGEGGADAGRSRGEPRGAAGAQGEGSGGALGLSASHDDR